MKIGIVYTSAPKQFTALVEGALRDTLGQETQFLSYEDESILEQVRLAGAVTASAIERLIGNYLRAVHDGAQIILNCCSSVGEVADAMAPVAALLGVPILRIDREMCRQAVRRGSRIGVLATLPTTLRPTRELLLQEAAQYGKRIEIIDVLADGAFGQPADRSRALLIQRAVQIAPSCDILVLAQGSMACFEWELSKEISIPVLSSPRLGAEAVRSTLKEKGLLS